MENKTNNIIYSNSEQMRTIGFVQPLDTGFELSASAQLGDGEKNISQNDTVSFAAIIKDDNYNNTVYYLSVSDPQTASVIAMAKTSEGKVIHNSQGFDYYKQGDSFYKEDKKPISSESKDVLNKVYSPEIFGTMIGAIANVANGYSDVFGQQGYYDPLNVIEQHFPDEFDAYMAQKELATDTCESIEQ